MDPFQLPREDLAITITEEPQFSGGEYKVFWVDDTQSYGSNPKAPHWGPLVANLTELINLPADLLVQNDCRIVKSTGSVYRWDNKSNITVDGTRYLASLSQPLVGRWILTLTSDEAVLNGEEVVLEGGKIVGSQIPTFIWTQTAPQSQWTVAHNLNRFPSVVVCDETNTQVLAGVAYLDANTVVVSANFPFTGFAYLN
jgi:hypothetical protein